MGLRQKAVELTLRGSNPGKTKTEGTSNSHQSRGGTAKMMWQNSGSREVAEEENCGGESLFERIFEELQGVSCKQASCPGRVGGIEQKPSAGAEDQCYQNVGPWVCWERNVAAKW